MPHKFVLRRRKRDNDLSKLAAANERKGKTAVTTKFFASDIFTNRFLPS